MAKRDLLLRYLLDALDDQEKSRVEEMLKTDPSARELLNELKETLCLLSEDSANEPPETLANRTCDLIFSKTPQEGCQSERSVCTGFTNMRLLDAAALAFVFIVLLALFIPAVQESQTQSRITECKNNLSQIGIALANYASLFDSEHFPDIPLEGRLSLPGFYGPLLVQYGAPKNAFTCPGSVPCVKTYGYQIPTIEEVQKASVEDYEKMMHIMGGTYGYPIGSYSKGKYQPPKNLRRNNFPVIADMPCMYREGLQSNNHNGRGQCVLNEAGNVTFMTVSTLEFNNDQIYLNAEGYVAPRMNQEDSVISLGCRPLRELINPVHSIFPAQK